MRTLRDRPGTSRLRIVSLIVAGFMFVLFLSANGIASVYTDWLWFRHLDVGSAWLTRVGTQWLLAVIFGVAFFAIFWGNLVLADRLKPAQRPVSAEEELVERYHAMVGRNAGKVRFALAAFFALVAGANTSAQWRTWILFRNGQDFGLTDPMFDRDLGFYVFRLPMWSFTVDWLFATLVLTLIVVMVAHYLNGGIRPSIGDHRVSRGIKIHVSLLLAALAVLRAVAYWFDRLQLVNSKTGNFDGALATDVLIREPAFNLLALISLFCGVLFIYNIFRPGWGLPAVAVAVWLASHFVIGNAFPLAYQRLRVTPVQSQREVEFVGRNIEATRFAYGLDEGSLTREQLDYSPGLSTADVEEYSDVLDNVPVVDPLLAFDEVTRIEADRQIYQFSAPLDVDRYMIDGQLRPVVLSARGLNVAEVGTTWESQHVIFTHGYGAAVVAGYDEATAASSGDSRALNFLISGLGNIEQDESFDSGLDQPQIYIGENFGGYAIVGADREEVDFQDGTTSELFSYDGEGGVGIGSLGRRVAFALRFRQLDPLISRNITNNSKVIYNRDVVDRVRTMAPFLRFDRDPYPVIDDGRVVWVLNGYTTTNELPYSQSVSTQIELGSSLAGGYNYVRNSVKVTVDAYDGTVHMYVVDEDDPIIAAWQQAFPSLFSPASEVPDVIRSHFKYPEELFTVQTDMWSDYVVSDPRDFIQKDVAWSIASQPRIEAQTEEGDTVSLPMNPQYLMARIPGEDQAEYVLQRAFVPRGGASGSNTARPELTGIMMARSDPGNYGELVLLDLPTGQINAPDLVHAEIRQSEDLTEFIKDKAGAKVRFGEMSIALVDDTIVFIRPVYVESNSATAVPELQRIVAVNGTRISMANTVEEALAGVITSTGLPTAGDDGGGDQAAAGDDDYSADGKSVVELISEANEFLLRADQIAENNPDEAEVFRQRAQTALEQARLLLGGAEPDQVSTSDDT